MSTSFQTLPEDLPAPVDDGACDHLPGMRLPAVSLEATSGRWVDMGELGPGRTVIYAYPRTGRPGEALPLGWDVIPGARGCTPEACAFRDHFAELHGLGVNAVFGLSTQDRAYQHEMAERLHLPFEVLSDKELVFTRAMRLPTFEVQDLGPLIRRLTLIVRDGIVERVFYPVFPPDQAARQVIGWLAEHP